MIDIDALLTELQDEVYFRSLSEYQFATVSIFRERPGEISNAAINQALTTLNERGGKIGACVIVLRPRIVKAMSSTTNLRFDATVTTRVLVTPLFNDDETQGTKKKVDALALTVARLHSTYKSSGRIPQLLIDGENPVEPFNEEIEAGTEGYDVTHRVPWGIENLVTCPTPQIDASNPEAITLDVAADGAAIFFTTDGSYPGSGNPEALLYAEPFAADAGTLIRAGAQHPDLVPSNTVSHQIL